MKTRNKIIISAQKLFSEEGFEKVSTKRIAQQANCNEVTIFRLFGTKDNLLEEIINKFVQESNIINELHKILTGNLDMDIEKSIMLYYDFLQQHEIIFRLQLKLSDNEHQKFIRTIDFKDCLVNHFMTVFQKNNIYFSPEVFVNNLLSSIMGGFLLKILTHGKFSDNKEEYFLEEKIKFYQDILKKYIRKDDNFF